MANGIRWATLILCCSVLCACTASEDRTDTAQTPDQRKAPIYRQQTETLDKAKNLARTIKKTEDARQQKEQEESKH
jgi:hypothetical protein